MNNAALGQYGHSVFYDGIAVELTQLAHCDVPHNANWDYQAYGVDQNGKEYLVKWVMYDCYKSGEQVLDDESEACNWELYTIAEVD
jgi:hypothetical protein